eukprot:TRINITY_DN123943_c0_g1_i1.p2 TRINITY_DN123943_c0_g1~~TRINITY_DN123943_c0_g1_i1.p2  ORF type:complete len:136 (-),score=15.57 TRINITY_DN123943_c0_g1_i1:392-799(-)
MFVSLLLNASLLCNCQVKPALTCTQVETLGAPYKRAIRCALGKQKEFLTGEVTSDKALYTHGFAHITVHIRQRRLSYLCRMICGNPPEMLKVLIQNEPEHAGAWRNTAKADLVWLWRRSDELRSLKTRTLGRLDP